MPNEIVLVNKSITALYYAILLVAQPRKTLCRLIKSSVGAQIAHATDARF
jgi:hypothetical protein